MDYSNMAYEVMTYAQSAAKRPRPATTCYASVFSAEKSGLSPCGGVGGNTGVEAARHIRRLVASHT
jgi:hypothetical protein